MFKNNKTKISKGGYIHRLLQKILEGEWLTIYVNKYKHLTYWKIVYNKERIVLIPQTETISSPIRNHRGIYFHNKNYFTIKKKSTITP